MPFLSFRQITKRFPGVRALDRVTFDVERGSCHALIGENGAGKSTIGKILAGIHTADSGEMLIEGERVHPGSPLAARRLGVAMVHQELAFCPNLTVAENLCLGELPVLAGWLDRPAMRRRAQAMLDEIHAAIDVDRPVAELSTGQEQMLQIAAALGIQARVIIMDEPTSSLSARESGRLFELVEHLKQRHVTLLYISHRMDEIFRLCDTVTVLRDGRHAGTEPVSATSREKLVHQMVGREIVLSRPRHLDPPLGEIRLRVENLASPGKFRGVSFEIRAGEVLGLAGLVGAGRSEIASAIFGLDAAASGAVTVDGKQIETGSVTAALEAGIGFLPEDRKRQGLVLSMNCRENASLAALKGLTRRGWIRAGSERAVVERYASQLRVRAPSIEAPVAGLSGGNQQKIALAKWLATRSRVLIVDEPTRGVDVGAKAEIHDLLDELACGGLAVLLISSELPELMSLSRRIMAVRDGEITGELQRDDFAQPALMRMMAGMGTIMLDG